MTVFEIGKQNLISFLSANVTGLNIVEQYQSVPKQATYPSLAVFSANVIYEQHVQEYSGAKMGTSTTLENYWGMETIDLTAEIVHNNRIARNNMMSTIYNLFIVGGDVRFNGSVFAIESYKAIDTAKEVGFSNWFAMFRFKSYTPVTYSYSVYRMDTIIDNITVGFVPPQ